MMPGDALPAGAALPWPGPSWECPGADAPRLLPGAALAIAVMLAAGALASLVGRAVLTLQGIDPAGKPSPISGIMVAIVLGMAIANTVGVPRVFAPGLDFAMKKFLRLGIILVGIRLSAFDVVALGALAIPVVATIVVVAIIVTTAFARRVGVSERFGTLAAAATAICGVTAALAVAPVIEADDREVAYTVAIVTLFGAAAMFIDPYLAHSLFGKVSASVGLFLGTGIHDTSQVMGAALSYKELFHDERALKIATVTKLTRNVFLVAVVPALAWMHARRTGGGRPGAAKTRIASALPDVRARVFSRWRSSDPRATRFSRTVPRRSGSGTPRPGPGSRRRSGKPGSSYALGTAMAAVGLGTRFSSFRGLGAKPLYVGAVSAGLVSALALVLAAIVGPHVR